MVVFDYTWEITWVPDLAPAESFCCTEDTLHRDMPVNPGWAREQARLQAAFNEMRAEQSNNFLQSYEHLSSGHLWILLLNIYVKIDETHFEDKGDTGKS